uniref:C-C motif chemokine n=1 Tax=Oryctolagus cuniculus TaxID=9986 RepID=A0A5F9DK47_RABIT
TRILMWALCFLPLCAALSPSILSPDFSCCTQVLPHLAKRFLKMVHTCHLQRADGNCDLDAVILYSGGIRFCVNPKNRTLNRWMKEQAANKFGQRIICHEKNSKESLKGHFSGGFYYTWP